MENLNVSYSKVNANERCILCGGKMDENHEMKTTIQIEEKEIFLCDICRDIFLRDILNSKIEGLDS